MAENKMVVEAAKLGESLIAAATVVKRAMALQEHIAGYETQADRLKETLTKDRETLENLRTQIQDATSRLRIATEKADGAEAERDRRFTAVAREEETALTQFRIIAQRDRERITQEIDTLFAELESKKQSMSDELAGERRRLQDELAAIEADIQEAKDRLERARHAHAEFVESLSRSVVETP